MGNDAVTPGAVFGRRMRQERERLGWRLRDLAGAVTELGIQLHPSAYAKMETGLREPDLTEAVTIAAALGQPLTAMLAAEAGEIAARAEDLTRQAVAEAEQAGESMIRAARLLNEAQALARWEDRT